MKRKYVFRIAGIIMFLAVLCTGVIGTRAQSSAAALSISSSRIDTASAAPISTESLQTQIQQKIQERAKELQDINAQIQSTQKDLNSVQSQRVSLQRELKTIDNTITGLSLNIKSDELTIEQLGYQIQLLQSDLATIHETITDKKNSIAEILRQIQRRDNTNVMTLMLSNSSLADALQESQALTDIRNRISVEVKLLSDLNIEYQNKISQTDKKHSQISFHKQGLQNRKYIIEDQKRERQVILADTRSKESLYQKKVSDLSKRQQEIANELETLDATLRGEINPGILPVPRPGIFAIPIEGGGAMITQDYGATNFARYGYQGKWHNGIDIGTPVGTPVFAADNGRVVAVGDQDRYCYRGAYGKFIVIGHPNNLTTLYGHLSRQVVEVGDAVKRGDLIGYSGRTGYATGAHLHFTVFASPTFSMQSSKFCGATPHGGDLNPLNYL